MGVSADPVDRQKEFDERNGLGFPLLSDPDREVARHFGAKRLGPLPSKRVTFVVAPDLTVVEVVRSETNMHTHADRALDALRRWAEAGSG